MVAATAHNAVAVIAWAVVARPGRGRVAIATGALVATVAGAAARSALTVADAGALAQAARALHVSPALALAFLVMQAAHYLIWLVWIPRARPARAACSVWRSAHVSDHRRLHRRAVDAHHLSRARDVPHLSRARRADGPCSPEIVVIAWLGAFVATCVIEVCVVRVVLRRARVSVVLAAQVATHPLVWLGMAVLPGSVIVRLSAVELVRRTRRGRDLCALPRPSSTCGTRALCRSKCGVLARALVGVAAAHDRGRGPSLA